MKSPTKRELEVWNLELWEDATASLLASLTDLLERVEDALGSAACIFEKYRASSSSTMWQAHQEADYQKVRALWDEVHNTVAAAKASRSDQGGDGA